MVIIMSIERKLLKKVISGDNKGDFFISYDLYKEIYEFLIHHEQPEQDKAEAVMPNGVCVSNVYDAYEEGRKSVMSEQEPLSEKEIEEYVSSLRSSTVSEEYYSEEWEEGFEDGVRWLEKQLENKQ